MARLYRPYSITQSAKSPFVIYIYSIIGSIPLENLIPWLYPNSMDLSYLNVM